MNRLEKILRRNRYSGKRSLSVFLNSGDPSLAITQDLIQSLSDLGVDFIELGVPFASSFTDGNTIIRSHQRALKQSVEFEDCLAMLKHARKDCDIPITMLLDFSHTVKSRGMETVVRECAACGADAILLHGLPPLFQNSFIEATEKYDIGRIFSLYPNSNDTKIADTVQNTTGFIYLVSQYGRTGSRIDFHSPTLQRFYQKVRKASDLPLMAGFGIKDGRDMQAIFGSSDIDGVILGSVLSQIIESQPPDIEPIRNAIAVALAPMIRLTDIPYQDLNLENNREYFAQTY